MFENISGHKRQLQLLEKALAKNTLAHAYVFAGPEGVGKKTIVKNLAEQMLEMKGEFHPDFLEVGTVDGIKIEQIRDLTYKLSLMPYQAKYKIALIDNADQMTTEAANALLKVLEEPKSYTYIFLITSTPNKLPKTILSRCQKITFGPVEINREETEEITQALKFYEIFQSDSISDRLISAYDIAELEANEIKRIFDVWLEKSEKNLQTSPSKVGAQKIFQIMRAQRFLEQNVNNKLLLTNLMLQTQG